MIKEELEKEAKEYADWFWGASPSMMKALAESYIKGAEPREKQIAELEAQIEKMKLCQNCKYEPNDYMEIPCRNCIRCLGDIKRKGDSDKWEIKEK